MLYCDRLKWLDCGRPTLMLLSKKTLALIWVLDHKNLESQTGVFQSPQTILSMKKSTLFVRSIEGLESNAEKKSIFKRVLKPKIIHDWVAVWREHGFKEFIKRKGWKVVAAVFLFYLIRDSFLYLLLPYFATRGILGC